VTLKRKLFGWELISCGLLLALLSTLTFLFGPATPLASGPMHTLGLLCIGLALAGVLVGLWRWWSAHRLIVRRLERLTVELTHLRGQADLAGAITEDGRDEVTALAHGLNLLLQQVARTQATRSLIEKQFQESEQRYRMLFSGMSEGFALLAIVEDAAGQPADYRFLAVNPAYARLVGLQDGALVGRTLREALPGVEPAQLERYRQVALSGAPACFTTFDAQGHRHCRINASRPAPDQLAVLIEDTTEQVQRDTELRASGERFRQLTSLAPVGVFLTNPQGHCEYVNDKWLAMTALSFSAAIGDSWLKAVHPDDRARGE